MTMQIEEPKHYKIGFHHLGFRPFFLLGSIFAIVAVSVWLWILSYQGSLPRSELGLTQWHAHEMLFGYSLAVISGFLLTAERNWTGVDTLRGAPLLLLASCWLLARILPFVPHPDAILMMVIADLIFGSFLCLALLYPIIKVRQWQHMATWSKVFLLVIANTVFYAGIFNLFDNGIQIGLYTGLYSIVSLLFLMCRRVLPFFIEKGVGYPVTLRNARWVDYASLILMLIFMVVEVFRLSAITSAITAVMLVVLHSWRLIGWYSHGIWEKPLLWSLYLGYAWLIIGFVLKVLSYWSGVNPMLSVHAFAYGGIGMMTIGMMARIALGHTGRNVFLPPRGLLIIFALLLLGAIVRVLLPIFMAEQYASLIHYAQWLWLVAFAGFVIIYAPMLVKGRIDGKWG